MRNKLKYRVENEELIVDYYFNNQKTSSINAGNIENILNKCKLYDEEYETLLKQNERMKHIAKDYEQLQQENKQLKDNWNKLKEYISAEWYCFDNESVEFEVAKEILDKMQELEQGSDSDE